jgi:hypothetical protein
MDNTFLSGQSELQSITYQFLGINECASGRYLVRNKLGKVLRGNDA